MRRKKHLREQHNLELTSCSDIIFTLLIFYIITQSYIVQLPAAMPELETGKAAIESNSQTIEILEDSSIIWNDTSLGKFSRAAISNQVMQNAEAKLIIIPQTNAPAGTLVELLDQLRACGVTDVVFGGKPKKAASDDLVDR